MRNIAVLFPWMDGLVSGLEHDFFDKVKVISLAVY